MLTTDKEFPTNHGYPKRLGMSARLTRPVDIALLASDAAIELEELLLGMNPTLTNVQELMKVLPDLVKPADITVPSSIDPTSALMVNQAFKDAHLASSIRDTAELAEEVQKLTSRLGEAIRPGAAKAEFIQGFKEFALALSRTASA
jgi:hypothetical protein